MVKGAMAQPPKPASAPADPGLFTAAERDLIRWQPCVRFDQAPQATDGIYLHTWRGRSQAGQPKVPKVVQGLVERGLVHIRPKVVMGGRRARFTPLGLDALRHMLQDRRALNPDQFAHLHEELGTDRI